MKPSLLFSLLLLCAHLCNGQNYACIQRNETRYFINEDGYLRGIQIDSVEISGSDTVLHPFKTERFVIPGSGLDESDGSWMGADITQRADGMFIFPTIWLRNVVVRTQAQPGDTWIFYTDTWTRHYKATVMALDTMTVLGTLDSIKTIRIASYTSYMGTTVDTADSINGYEMIISKDHGFVKTFDLYLFPYRTGGGTLASDFYLDQAGGIGKRKSTFILTDFHVPTTMELYDFNAGDVFVTSGETYNEIPEQVWLTYDSIMSRTTINPWRVEYQVYMKENRRRSYHPWGGPSIIYNEYNTSTTTIAVDTFKAFDMAHMPEEVMHRVWHYLPGDSSNCFKSAYYRMDDVVLFEGGPNYFSYKTGFEQLSFGTHTPPHTSEGEIGSHSTRHAELVFSIKNGIPCGMRAEPNGVIELHTPIVINIYPNPANDRLYISSAYPIADVSICDITGRQVYTANELPAEAMIDVSALLPGMYILRANGMVQKFVKQ